MGLSNIEGSIVATDIFGTSAQLIEIVTKNSTYWTLPELFGQDDSVHFSARYSSAHFSGTAQSIFVYKNDKVGYGVFIIDRVPHCQTKKL